MTPEVKLPEVNLSVIDKQASMLGGHHSLMRREKGGGRERLPVCFSSADPDLFVANLPGTEKLYDVLVHDVNFLTEILQMYYTGAQRKVTM